VLRCCWFQPGCGQPAKWSTAARGSFRKRAPLVRTHEQRRAPEADWAGGHRVRIIALWGEEAPDPCPAEHVREANDVRTCWDRRRSLSMQSRTWAERWCSTPGTKGARPSPSRRCGTRAFCSSWQVGRRRGRRWCGFATSGAPLSSGSGKASKSTSARWGPVR
jgi:hypothetical protein